MHTRRSVFSTLFQFAILLYFCRAQKNADTSWGKKKPTAVLPLPTLAQFQSASPTFQASSHPHLLSDSPLSLAFLPTQICNHFAKIKNVFWFYTWWATGMLLQALEESKSNFKGPLFFLLPDCRSGDKSTCSLSEPICLWALTTDYSQTQVSKSEAYLDQ